MKRLKLILVIIPILLFGCSTGRKMAEKAPSKENAENPARPVDFHEASTWLLGYFTRQMMTRPPHSEWFQKGYDAYKPDEAAVNKLTELSKDGLSIKIVMGSWCPDSRREVPRFMKILDIWQFPAEKVIFIGVDDSKISPVGEYKNLDILRVPTFIVYKNNVEAGRIIENPVTSLEQDMVNILTRE